MKFLTQFELSFIIISLLALFCLFPFYYQLFQLIVNPIQQFPSIAPAIREVMDQQHKTSIQQGFRFEIRRRNVQKMRKQKRQIFFEHQMTMLEPTIYQKVFDSPQLIYSEKEKYLLMLREALNSADVKKYLYRLNYVLEVLIRFYYGEQRITEYCELFMECIGCIFYEGNISSDENGTITHAIKICLGQLDHSKNWSQTLRNRCLITLLNITALQNPQICQSTIQMHVLEQLQLYLEQLPVNNEDKAHILAIYGNLLQFMVNNNFGVDCEYYYSIVKYCLQENYDKQILEGCMEIHLYLATCPDHQFITVLKEMQQFFFMVNSSDLYLKKMENLCLRILRRLNSSIDNIIQIQGVVLKIHEQLIAINLKFNGDYDYEALITANKMMIDCHNKFFGEGPSSIYAFQLCNAIFDNWIQRQDYCSCNEQLVLMELLATVLSSQQNFAQLLKENTSLNHKRRNKINKSVLGCIFEFLKSVDLETNQQKKNFLKIMLNSRLAEMMTPEDRDRLMQKIEGCFYLIDSQIEYMAKSALHLHEGLSKKF